MAPSQKKHVRADWCRERSKFMAQEGGGGRKAYVHTTSVLRVSAFGSRLPGEQGN